MKNILGSSYTIVERKSSQFGAVGIVDRGSELSKTMTVWDRRRGQPVTLAYYNNLRRKDIYVTALDKYVHDQIARPIVNLISDATFGQHVDFQGDSRQVKTARKVVRDSNIDWNMLGADLEVHGDIFIQSFFGKNPKIASIPPQSIDVDYDEKNIIDIRAYVQDKDGANRRISPAVMTHGKINCTSNMVYGSSHLRPVFWWLDVLDNLWERVWIRCAQYYGSPMVSVVGVPVQEIASVIETLEAKPQRPGRNLVFPEGTKVDTLDFAKGYPIQDLVDRVYQYILSACGIPQHLVYESDSSRGVAMFSGDAFEMLINMRRKTWKRIIVSAIGKILISEGMKPDELKLDVKWSPVFQRDLKDLGALITAARQLRIFSLKSARERLGLDHSEEEENVAKEKPEDNPNPVVQKPMASSAAAASNS